MPATFRPTPLLLLRNREPNKLYRDRERRKHKNEDILATHIDFPGDPDVQCISSIRPLSPSHSASTHAYGHLLPSRHHPNSFHSATDSVNSAQFPPLFFPNKIRPKHANSLHHYQPPSPPIHAPNTRGPLSSPVSAVTVQDNAGYFVGETVKVAIRAGRDDSSAERHRVDWHAGELRVEVVGGLRTLPLIPTGVQRGRDSFRQERCPVQPAEELVLHHLFVFVFRFSSRQTGERGFSK